MGGMQSPSVEQNYRSGLFWATFAGLGFLGYLMLRPFVTAILWAIVLSVLIWPIHTRFRKKMGENLAATCSVLSTIFIVIIPLGLCVLLIATQFKPMGDDPAKVGNQHVTIESVVKDLDKNLILPNVKKLNSTFSLEQYWKEHQGELQSSLKDPVGKAALGLANGALTLVISLLTMFFVLRDGHQLRDPLNRLLPIAPERITVILERQYNTVRGVFMGVVLVALVQGGLATTFYLIAGAPSAIILGLVTTVLCVIPLLGAPVIYIPVGLSMLLQNNFSGAAWVLIGGFGIVSQIDNVLKPFLIGSRVNLHSMGVFFSILGGILVFGPVGLMVGPMVLSIMNAFIELILEMRAEPLPS